MMKKKMTLCAQYLKKLRAEHDFSQQYVASKLGVTRQTYSHYETGRITPPARSLVMLADLYQIPLEKLVMMAHGVRGEEGQKTEEITAIDGREERILEYYEDLNERDKQMMFSILELLYECEKGQ